MRDFCWIVRVTGVPDDGEGEPDESWYRMQARWFLSQSNVFGDAGVTMRDATILGRLRAVVVAADDILCLGELCGGEALPAALDALHDGDRGE